MGSNSWPTRAFTVPTTATDPMLPLALMKTGRPRTRRDGHEQSYDPRGKLIGDLLKGTVPLSGALLANRPHRWVPQTYMLAGSPMGKRLVLQEHPARTTKSPSKMDNSSADAHDIVQRGNLGGNTIQIIPCIDALILIDFDAVFPAGKVDGVLGVTVLERNEMHAIA